MGNCYNKANHRSVTLTWKYRAVALLTGLPQKTSSFLPQSKVLSDKELLNFSSTEWVSAQLNVLIYVRIRKEANPWGYYSRWDHYRILHTL